MDSVGNDEAAICLFCGGFQGPVVGMGLKLGSYQAHFVIKRHEQKRLHLGHTLEISCYLTLSVIPFSYSCMYRGGPDCVFSLSGCISRQHKPPGIKGHWKVPRNEWCGAVTLSPDPSSGSMSQ